MPTALVTGATRGIGYATARLLARQGFTVLVAARDAAAGTDAARAIGHGARSVQLDVTSPASVRVAADLVQIEHGHLDILVNNAGILPEFETTSPGEAVDAEMFRTTFATNLFGAVQVLEAFLPLLRRARVGRIVNVSSSMGSMAHQTDPSSPYYETLMPAYQASKAALNSLTISLARRLADTPITVTSVCPGFVQTELTPINRDHAPRTPEQAAEVIVRAATLPASAASGTFIDAQGVVPW
ncbi:MULTISPECIES: SDR family NAD(P)-dependent oxidoreductase [Arsenicicoccus]|uniref:SDR family NAD(P)-dependent oxidoreductase n=1 Tax=Arsenicicoccus TaxID=267408 RepID=UPI00257FFFD3|nr:MULTISPECIES: SDR family NAD(P)-dependent oxidoreductase [Arsenicicoccus]